MTKNDEPNHLLLEAASRWDLAGVIAALSQGADVNARDAGQNSVLHIAAYRGYTNILETLVENGANVDAKNAWDDTPLHLAALRGRRDAVETLIKLDADVTAKNRWQETALDLAVVGGHAEWMAALGEAMKEGRQKLHVNRITEQRLTANEGHNRQI